MIKLMVLWGAANQKIDNTPSSVSLSLSVTHTHIYLEEYSIYIYIYIYTYMKGRRTKGIQL